jgi:hypothetical protein
LSTVWSGSSYYRQKLDHQKAHIARDAGITLIPIPFWWDKSPASLIATVSLVRPDLQIHDLSGASPIPREMPAVFDRRVYKPSAARELAPNVDITNWYCLFHHSKLT